MKITKVMIASFALLLVAALFVAPAAARTDIDIIEAGDYVFVYEEDLDISDLNTFTDAIELLVKYSGEPGASGVDDQINVVDESSFSVPSGHEEGTYYAVNGTGTTGGYLIIEEPALTLSVVLQSDLGSDVTSVSKATPVLFKIKSGQVGNEYHNATNTVNATVTVKVQKEGEPFFTTFGGLDLTGINLTASTQYTAAIDLTDVKSGDYIAKAVWSTPDEFATFADDSEAVAFNVRTEDLTIESNKDSVIRGGSFVVTISGNSKESYAVYVKDAGLDEAADYPQIPTGQDGVEVITDVPVVGDEAGEPSTAANVTTNAAGTRQIKFSTTVDTNDKTFTIKVYDYVEGDDDTVKVDIEKGAMTIVASGDQSYFLGEEVTFSGTNTDSDDVFLFIVGPNLPSDGGYLAEPDLEVNEDALDEDDWDDNDSYTEVEEDDTWSLDWETLGKDIDAGTYTIYAVSDIVNKGGLEDVKYDSVSIVVKKPFVTASTSSDTVAKGDDVTVMGTAEGDPDNIKIWVLGKNYYDDPSADVEDDGTFEEDIDTDNLASGQYFVVVQHPMYDQEYNVDIDGDDIVYTYLIDAAADTYERETDLFRLEGIGSLQGSDAAQALKEALDEPNIDDTYALLSFLVEEAWLTIDSVGDKYVGDVFTITGNTNLADGNELVIEVVSSSFKPTEKTQSGEFSGDSGTTEVVKGDVYNDWSFDLDTSTFKPDEYIVRVESISPEYTATTTFDVLAGAAPTEVPTEEPTEVPTEEPTEEPTAAPEPTPAPGFGALIALIGLGAVAVLVLRKH